MNAAASRSSSASVVVVWSIVLIAFGAFNAVYWPVVSHQAAVDPMNFIDRAQVLYATGRTEEAMGWMRRGIAEHRPPLPAPYVQLHKWYSQHNYSEAARSLVPRLGFYEALATYDLEERGRLLEDAVIQALALWPAPAPAPATSSAISSMAFFIAELYQMQDTVSRWNDQERLSLLRLTGGHINPARLIGNTGVHSPVDILVMSGGGDGPSKTARIFAGDRDYAGNRRGLHVMLVEPVQGAVLSVGTFDLWDSPEEVDRLAVFLEEAPRGVIGVFAVLDNAAGNMTPRLEQELLRFGLQREALIDRRLVLFDERFSFAAIGVKGAPLGSALQAWSPGHFLGVPGHPVVVGVLQDVHAEAPDAH